MIVFAIKTSIFWAPTPFVFSLSNQIISKEVCFRYTQYVQYIDYTEYIESIEYMLSLEYIEHIELMENRS